MTTIRKHLVNAFTKIAKSRGWCDSKKTPHTLNRYGFKSARQWGRMMAGMYGENILDLPNGLVDMIEEAARSDSPLTQADFDDFAEEEISCW